MAPASGTSKPAAFWLLAVINALLAAALIALVAWLLLAREDETLHAISTGQRLTISTKTGEISGTMRSLQAQEAEEPAETPPAESPEVAPKTVPETESKKKPAYDMGPPEDAAAPVEQPAAATGVAPVTVDTESLIGSEDMPVDNIKAVPRSDKSLPRPAEGLLEDSAFGPLPKTGPEGTPRRYYARGFTLPDPPQPIVGVLLLDAGLNQDISQDAMHALPPAISLALSPYAAQLGEQADNARNLGHEPWLMLPAEPADYPASDPGPKALLGDLTNADNITRMKQVMAAYPGYVGLALPINEHFSETPSQLEPIVREAAERGLAMLAAEAPTNSRTADMLRSTNGMGMADVVLDARLSETAVTEQLAELERRAVTTGHALAVGRPFPLTVEQLTQWSASLVEKNIVLAPASAIIEIRHR